MLKQKYSLTFFTVLLFFVLSSCASISTNNLKNKEIYINYDTSNKNKEYIIENLLLDQKRFNAVFNEESGLKIKNDLLSSNLLYFCNSVEKDQQIQIEKNLFKKENNEENTFVIYSKDFLSYINELRINYPNVNYYEINEKSYELFSNKILNIDSSIIRSKEIQKLDFGIEITHEPRRRQDLQRIYFVISYSEAKSLIPIFISNALDVDYYGTSRILIEAPNVKKISDFEGLFIPIPEEFFKIISEKNPTNSLKQEYEKLLISDLLVIEQYLQTNKKIKNLKLNSGYVSNNQSCLRRDMPILQIKPENI